MRLAVDLFNLDIPPDYVRRLESEGIDLDSLEVGVSVAWYDGSVWTQDGFVGQAAKSTTFELDFDLFELWFANVADSTTQIDVSISLDAERGGTPFHIGDGSATFDRPFYAARGLAEIACVDLQPEDGDDSDDPEIEEVDIRFDFAYMTWRLASSLDLKATLEGESAPFSPDVYLDPAPDTSAQPDMWQYRPQSDATIVVGRDEWASFPVSTINWQSWDTAQDGDTSGPYRGVFHKPRPSRSSQQLRGSDEVTTILLHETAGWRIDHTNYVPTKWRTGTLGTQFKVQTDGRVVQMYDALQRTSHVSTAGFNARSVGIEIVNLVAPAGTKGLRTAQIARRFDRWDGRDGVFVFQMDTAPDFLRDRSPRALVALRPTSWIILPTLEQLEATYQLALQLHALGVRPENPLHDPGLIFPADLSDDQADRFLLDTWISELSPQHGVICHGSIQANRSDGYAASLYCWLRSGSTVSGYGARQAFEGLLDIFDFGLLRHRCADGARRWCADTAGFAPPQHVRNFT